MRITNSMITNQLLLNINRNSRNVQGLYMQWSSGKRIQRPSDNPIIASRALRFRTNVSEVEQFQRNALQGSNWMESTETALSRLSSLLTSIGSDRLVQGSSGTYTFENRQNIVEQINQIFEQINQELNATVAGRYLFSGFRTDRPPISTNNEFFTVNHPDYPTNTTLFDGLLINKSINSNDIQQLNAHFWRNPANNQLERMVRPDFAPGLQTEFSASELREVNIIKLPFREETVGDRTRYVRNFDIPGFNVVEVSIDGPNNPYIVPAAGTIHFIRETGELVIHSDDISSFDSGIDISYSMNGVLQGELNPFVFFDTEHIHSIESNTPGYFDIADSTTFGRANHEIRFEMGTNVQITVNSTAVNAYPWQLFADLTAFVQTIRSVSTPSGMPDDLEAIERGFFSIALHERFGDMLGRMESHSNVLQTEHTTLGARMNRVETISDRLAENRTTFIELMDENENANTLEVGARLAAAEAILQAAMMMGSRISQLSLVNFI